MGSEDDVLLSLLLDDGLGHSPMPPSTSHKRGSQMTPMPDTKPKLRKLDSGLDNSSQARHSTSWAKWLREDLAETLEARGRQLRPLNLVSCCSGMATHNRAIQELRGDKLSSPECPATQALVPNSSAEKCGRVASCVLCSQMHS